MLVLRNEEENKVRKCIEANLIGLTGQVIFLTNESSLVFVYNFWTTVECCAVNTKKPSGKCIICIKLVPESKQSKQTTGLKMPREFASTVLQHYIQRSWTATTMIYYI